MKNSKDSQIVMRGVAEVADPSEGGACSGTDRLPAEIRADLLAEVLDLAAEAIICIDPNHRIAAFSVGAEKIFGYTPEEVIGQHFEILLPIASRSIHERHVENFEGSRKPNMFMAGTDAIKGLRKDGTEFPAEASISKIAKEDGIHFALVLHDISALKQAEASEARLGHILDSSLNEIYIFNAGTLKCEKSNRGARANLGYAMEEMRTFGLHDIILEIDRDGVDGLVASLRDGTRSKITLETKHKRKNGSSYDAETYLELIESDGHHVFVAFARDISQRKAQEEKLRLAAEEAAQANRSKSEFLANMSHELRTPLNAILGFSDLMRQEAFGPIGDDQYLEYAGDIFDSGTHLLSLINDILDSAKVDAGRFSLNEKLIDVADAILRCERMVKSLAEGSEVEIVNCIDQHLPPLYCDERAIKQMLLNLLSNSIKFTDEGGEIIVSANITGDGQMSICVADNGIGIAPDDLQKVLLPFSQADAGLSRGHQGTGLGLSLTKSLIELHQGSLSLESEVDVGTAATIRFPADRAIGETFQNESLVPVSANGTG